ncbi:MAG: GNAT family N-acetyltransferase [Ardenticatenaceae bacterium]
MTTEWQRGDYRISSDKSQLDLDIIHDYLAVRSYWAAGRSREIIERSIENSLTFGVYDGDQQIGLTRVITDYATFAYLCDVFVLDAYQGQGLGTWMMEVISAHPDLQSVRFWTLATRDAHGLYQKVGFTPLQAPHKFMEKRISNQLDCGAP